MTNAITFSTKDKSAILSYGDVAKTMRLGDSYGQMPKQVPVQPGELLVQIQESIWKHAKMEIIPQPVIIREPYCQTNLNKVKSGKSLELEDYLLKRFVTKFSIADLSGFEGTPDQMMGSFALTYAYTDSIKGIQVAFGENVAVCDNLSAFGPYHFSTYGNNKCSFEEGMQLLTHWIQNLRTIHDTHIDAIQLLMNYKVPKERFQWVLGNLFEKAVRFNSGDNTISAPLNQSQVAQMVHSGLDVLKSDTEFITGWQIMNWGTNTLKAQTSDMVGLLQSTTAFNDFIMEEFEIPVEFLI